MWRRLAQLEASLGYCFREKGLLREAPLLNYCGYSYSSTRHGYTHHCHAHHDEAFTHAAYLLTMAIFLGVHARRLLTYYGYIL